MFKKSAFLFLLAFSFTKMSLFAAANLKLKPHLDYTSNSQDGQLIAANQKTNVTIHPGKPAYILFTIHRCYNSKNQAKRTVALYQKYKGKVDFILVDLDAASPKKQTALKARFYRGYVPWVTVISGKEKVVYNRSGEVHKDVISKILDDALKK